MNPGSQNTRRIRIRWTITAQNIVHFYSSCKRITCPFVDLDRISSLWDLLNNSSSAAVRIWVSSSRLPFSVKKMALTLVSLKGKSESVESMDSITIISIKNHLLLAHLFVVNLEACLHETFCIEKCQQSHKTILDVWYALQRKSVTSKRLCKRGYYDIELTGKVLIKQEELTNTVTLGQSFKALTNINYDSRVALTWNCLYLQL